MSLIEHAKREFEILGWPGDDEMQQLMCKQILELLELFMSHGHSGFSAPYAINLFTKLAKFDTISPLTGDDSEWIEVGDDVYQNNRNSAVFKEGKDGQAYWVNGKVFREPDGCTYTSRESRVYIDFPWQMPESEIVDVEGDFAV